MNSDQKYWFIISHILFNIPKTLVSEFEREKKKEKKTFQKNNGLANFLNGKNCIITKKRITVLKFSKNVCSNKWSAFTKSQEYTKIWIKMKFHWDLAMRGLLGSSKAVFTKNDINLNANLKLQSISQKGISEGTLRRERNNRHYFTVSISLKENHSNIAFKSNNDH